MDIVTLIGLPSTGLANAPLAAPPDDVLEKSEFFAQLPYAALALAVVLALAAVVVWLRLQRWAMTVTLGGLSAAAGLVAASSQIYTTYIQIKAPKIDAPTPLPGQAALNRAKSLASRLRDLERRGPTVQPQREALATEVIAAAKVVSDQVSPGHPFALSASLVSAYAYRQSRDFTAASKLVAALLAEPALTVPTRSTDFPDPADNPASRPAKLAEPSLLAQTRIEKALLDIDMADDPAGKLRGLDDLYAVEHLGDVDPSVAHEARFGIIVLHERLGHYDRARAMCERIIERFEGPEKSWASQAKIKIPDLDEIPLVKAPVGQLPPGRKVSGALPVGQTLWPASEPHVVVTGDLTVPAGATLTIEPGVTVHFAEGHRLLVHGRLVTGQSVNHTSTPAKPVVFTAAHRRRGGFAWRGVHLDPKPGQPPSELANTTIESAVVGLLVEAGQHEITTCRFQGCGRSGARVAATTQSRNKSPQTKLTAAFRDCLFEANLGAGADVRGAGAEAIFENCRLIANDEFGLVAADGAFVAVVASAAQANREDGIALMRAARGLLRQTTLKANKGLGLRLDFRCELTAENATVTDNARSGLLVLDSTVDLRHSTLSANGEAGLVLGLAAKAAVTANTLADNRAGVGIRIHSGAKDVALRANRITGHRTGILTGDVASLKLADAANDLSGNAPLALWCQTPTTLDATGNYWGHTDPAKVAALIRGEGISHTPFLTQPPAPEKP